MITTGEGILADINKIGTINVDFTFEDLKKYILESCTTWQRGTPIIMINYDYRNKKS